MVITLWILIKSRDLELLNTRSRKADKTQRHLFHAIIRKHALKRKKRENKRFETSAKLSLFKWRLSVCYGCCVLLGWFCQWCWIVEIQFSLEIYELNPRIIQSRQLVELFSDFSLKRNLQIQPRRNTISKSKITLSPFRWHFQSRKTKMWRLTNKQWKICIDKRVTSDCEKKAYGFVWKANQSRL